MTKFKFGDRVKVVCKERYYYGKEGVVKGEIKIGTDFIYFVVLQNQDTCFYFTEELEKVEEYVTKFKVGDKVEVVTDKLECFGYRGIVTYLDYPCEVLLDEFGRVYLYEDEIEKVEEDVTREYEVGKPYLWFGGECPVPYGTSVSIRFGSKNFDYIEEGWTYTEYAHDIDWQHEYEDDNIVMFKVVEYPKQTRKVELELSEEEITTIKEVLGKVNL